MLNLRRSLLTPEATRLLLIWLGAATAAAPALSHADVRDHRGARPVTAPRPIVRDHRGNPPVVVQPGTGGPVRPVRPGTGPGVRPGPGRPDRPVVVVPARGRPIRIRAPRNNDRVEVDSTALVANSVAARGCEAVGEVLREVSNKLLSGAAGADAPPVAGHGDYVWIEDGRAPGHWERRSAWARNVHDPEYWRRVWARLAEMYRDCDMPCFDDGVAIGQMSAAGYCAASIAVGGLNSTGFTAQLPLPLCENSLFVGCQSGYQQTAATYPGCATYAQGSFEQIFNDSQSQDCHID